MPKVSLLGRREVRIPLDGDRLLADLTVPPGAQGIVLFAHGSGSGRRSPRNRAVAEVLERRGLATLLLDLLTDEEAREDERNLTYRFQISLLGDRLVAAVDWVLADPLLRSLRIGLYGASTGGAAALRAAAARPDQIRALVLRGARSDLAAESFPYVKAPTLLLVGGRDPPILEIARETSRRLAAPHSTTVIPQATHLFEEPGALEAVAQATAEWFCRYLAEGSLPAPAPSRGAGHTGG